MPTKELRATVGPLIVLAPFAVGAVAKAAVPWQYRALFQEFGAPTGRENLLHALAWHESGMNPNAIGPQNSNGTHDYGLFQINEANFARLGLTKTTALLPRESTRAATQLLAEITRTPGLSVWDIISIYNAGPSSEQGRVGHPKQLSTGGYVNPSYVAAVQGRLTFVSLAALAPGA